MRKKYLMSQNSDLFAKLELKCNEVTALNLRIEELNEKIAALKEENDILKSEINKRSEMQYKTAGEAEDKTENSLNEDRNNEDNSEAKIALKKSNKINAEECEPENSANSALDGNILAENSLQNDEFSANNTVLNNADIDSININIIEPADCVQLPVIEMVDPFENGIVPEGYDDKDSDRGNTKHGADENHDSKIGNGDYEGDKNISGNFELSDLAEKDSSVNESFSTDDSSFAKNKASANDDAGCHSVTEKMFDEADNIGEKLIKKCEPLPKYAALKIGKITKEVAGILMYTADKGKDAEEIVSEALKENDSFKSKILTIIQSPKPEQEILSDIDSLTEKTLEKLKRLSNKNHV